MTNTREREAGAVPTDLELMMYFDGELEGERLAAVEAHLKKERTARKKHTALGLVSGIVREEARATGEKGADIADSVMDLIEAEEKKPKKSEPARDNVVPLRAKPANDGGRTMYLVAAALVAAAAAVFLWGRTSNDDEAARRRKPPSVLVQGEKSAASEPSNAPKIEPDKPEGAHGVEVATVDFGGRKGAVFYVPSETTESDTTVVWLSDDSAGENE
jgi:anti-sigma factor RsiW